jgi:GT2 family glycosyltransferase
MATAADPVARFHAPPDRRPSDAHDLAVVIVAIPNQKHWFEACLPTIRQHAGDIAVDVVVAENGSTDGTRELIEREFPWARVVACENRGFAHGNNRAIMTSDARYFLFLNPDTQILEGTFAALIDQLDKRPEIGLAGVKQVLIDGELSLTIRRFPSPTRALFEGLGSERFPFRASWLGERELDPAAYTRETRCDWTSGSFMLARREALLSAGLMDERFFLYSEEPDLCRRIRLAGWQIVHLPSMTILHHTSKGRINPKMITQEAFARRQYAAKYFPAPRRFAYLSALSTGYLRRIAFSDDHPHERKTRRSASIGALRVLWGIGDPPFGAPPTQALAEQTPNRKRVATKPIGRSSTPK